MALAALVRISRVPVLRFSALAAVLVPSSPPASTRTKPVVGCKMSVNVFPVLLRMRVPLPTFSKRMVLAPPATTPVMLMLLGVKPLPEPLPN